MQTSQTHITLAVLPLQVLAQDPKVDMFCQGLAMDLTTDLSRFRSIQIIAYDSQILNTNDSLTDANWNKSHLDYLVKGLARQQGEQLVFNIQLINVQENHLVWSEKFTSAFEELFQVQEQIVEKIVGSLQQFVDDDLLNTMRRKSVTTLNAYECWLRGYSELKKGTVESDEQARLYFKQAMDIDPGYSRAYMGMSLSYFNEWSCQLWSRWDVSRNGAFEWAHKALELDELDHVSNAILGRIYLYNGDYERAEHYLRKSLQINANDAETLIVVAVGFAYLGYTKEAKELYERVRRLSATERFAEYGAFILFEAGDIDEAISMGERYEVGKGWVDYPAFLAAAHYLKGDYDKMHHYWQRFLDEFAKKINNGQPADDMTALRWMINTNPYRDKTQLRPFWDYKSQANSEELREDKSLQNSMAHSNQFVQNGKLWHISFEGQHTQLPDFKGNHDLVRLLSQPHQAIHCTDLMGAQTVERGQEVFDDQARAEYQQRILELQEDMKEAEALGNHERFSELQEEYDQLVDHLSSLLGKGGKTRKVSGTVEKCRSAVTWRIRSAIKKINEVHPALARHLRASIKTGIFCEYAPEREIEWQL